MRLCTQYLCHFLGQILAFLAPVGSKTVLGTKLVPELFMVRNLLLYKLPEGSGVIELPQVAEFMHYYIVGQFWW